MINNGLELQGEYLVISCDSKGEIIESFKSKNIVTYEGLAFHLHRVLNFKFYNDNLPIQEYTPSLLQSYSLYPYMNDYTPLYEDSLLVHPVFTDASKAGDFTGFSILSPSSINAVSNVKWQNSNDTAWFKNSTDSPIIVYGSYLKGEMFDGIDTGYTPILYTLISATKFNSPVTINPDGYLGLTYTLNYSN